MKLRRVPGTAIDVSPVCLGTMTYGRPVERDEAIRLTHLALDLGVNFIDTANIYEGYDRVLGSRGGVAETILGEALAGARDRAVLTTKVGCPVGKAPVDVGLGRVHVVRELEKSLARLRTDYIDFYLAHVPDPTVPLAEVAELFDSLVRSGKVRHWGFSNFDGADVLELLRICAARDYVPPRLSQPPYSVLCRDIEAAYLPMCSAYGIGVAAFRVLEGGLLSGKYAQGREPPPGSRGRDKPAWIPADKRGEGTLRRIAAFSSLARAAEMTPAQCAIAWVIAQPGVTAAVVGVSSQEQLREAVHVVELAGNGVGRLDQHQLLELDLLAPHNGHPRRDAVNGQVPAAVGDTGRAGLAATGEGATRGAAGVRPEQID